MIGIFDSGFGGLSVLKEVQKALPHHSYLYLGDTARAPYGNRDMDAVYRFTKEGVEFLFNHGCKLVVIACNTASAKALRKLQQEYAVTHPRRKVLGVIIPAVEEAVEKTKNGRIGVIGTHGTVASETFPREFEKRLPEAVIFQRACPLLVSLVETGEHTSPKADALLKKYLGPLLAQDIDTLVLGCTHYGHLEKKIRAVAGKRVRIISEGKVIAQKLTEYLKRHPEIASRLSKRKEMTFYTTGREEKFRTLGSKFFGKPITPRKVGVLELTKQNT